jgi:hypothetical protein
MKRSSEPNAGEPEAKAAAVEEATNWRRFDVAQLNAPVFSPSKGAYGGWYGDTTCGPAKRAVLVTGPAMRVLHDPDVWDDEKQAQWSVDKTPLKADRKSDKFNVEMEAPEAFVKWLFAYRTALAGRIHAQLGTFIDPGHPDFEDMDARTIAGKFYELAKKDKEGRWVFKLDGRCEKGAKDVPLTLETIDGAALPAGARLGRNSRVVPVFRADSLFVSAGFKNVKVYLKPVKFVVLEHAPPAAKAIEPASVRAQLDDDDD